MAIIEDVNALVALVVDLDRVYDPDKHGDDEPLGSRLSGPDDGWHWTVSMNVLRVQVTAMMRTIWPTRTEAYEDASKLADDCVASGSWRLGHESAVAVYSAMGDEDETETDQPVAGWYGHVSLMLWPVEDAAR